MLFNRLLVLGFGLLTASACFGSYYFIPVSATHQAETWYTQGTYTDYADTPVNERTKYLPETNVPGEAGPTPNTANVNATSGSAKSNAMSSVVSDPAGTSPLSPPHAPGGILTISLDATTNSNSPYFINAFTSISYTFFVYGPQASMTVDFSTTGVDQNVANFSLTGPGGTLYPNGSYTDLPVGDYTLNTLASTEYLDGVGEDGSLSGYVYVLPEPACGIGALAAMVVLCRRTRK